MSCVIYFFGAFAIRRHWLRPFLLQAPTVAGAPRGDERAAPLALRPFACGAMLLCRSAGRGAPCALRRARPWGGLSYFTVTLHLALVIIVLLFQVLTGGLLLTPNNVASLIQQNAHVLILSVGMLMVIVGRHIDLSVGSVVGFIGGVIGIFIANFSVPWPVAVLVAFALGALIGCWHGFWVAIMEIPAFIVTLASMLLFRGLTVLLIAVAVDVAGKRRGRL